MSHFFIFPESFYFNIFLLFVSLFFFPPFVTFFYAVFFFTYLYFIRRRTIHFSDSQSITNNPIICPIDGVVKEIYDLVVDSEDMNNRSWTYIQFYNPFHKPHGLYFPFISEVDYIFQRGKSKFWGRSKSIKLSGKDFVEINSTWFILKNRNKQYVKLFFPKVLGNYAPRFWAKSGDRGRTAACLGYLPWGGTILLGIPKDSDILIKKDEIVLAGETLIARLKG